MVIVSLPSTKWQAAAQVLCDVMCIAAIAITERCVLEVSISKIGLTRAGLAVQAVLLTVGRLCCMLDTSSAKLSKGAEELSRMALTLLLDTLSSDEMSGLPQVTACAVHILASLGISYGLQDCRSPHPCTLPLSGSLSTNASQHYTMHPCYLCFNLLQPGCQSMSSFAPRVVKKDCEFWTMP